MSKPTQRVLLGNVVLHVPSGEVQVVAPLIVEWVAGFRRNGTDIDPLGPRRRSQKE